MHWRYGGKWLAMAVLAVGGATGAGTAAAAATAVAPVPMTLAGSLQWDQKASASGREYRVFVSIPDRPPPPAGYRVLYVLDGNAMFLTAVEAARAMERRPDVPRDAPAVVVGIGYPPGTDIGAARAFDLTPPGSEHARIRAATGGADAFLDFIERDLKPALAAQVALDPAQQALFGHSFGGLFVLHALAARPQAFQTWIAASPSVWMIPQGLREAIGSLAGRRDAASPPLRLLVTVGEHEQRPAPALRAHPDARKLIALLQERTQVDNARAIAALAGGVPGIEVRLDEIAGEDHGTVVPGAIGRAVWFALAPPLPAPPLPTAQEYLRMTPEQRYDLRLWVRELPDGRRIPWLAGLKRTLHDGLTAEQVQALHAERNRMDQEYGTRPHEVNAPK
ncbi:esterase [Pseudoxanthomonas broegbernensis]|uniref:Esterase n=1 Tax=Pseudoxanthomonas broegbernensis TaxID=83619 RepID=A0A7V8GKL9_9GAMM|nr:alpha/beta hydrolase-fold protein [Pseudoxanthomonas broegbernensis]KAF1685082.1 esterase [Pseudoxanthomonas broegbernensis]MBB6066256.1 hypothetical protein [Pseudoxanthomonas broegbernensis]